MSRADWTRWIATTAAVVTVLVGFLALGEVLPGGDELPFLMLAQNLLGNSGLSTQTSPAGPRLHSLATHQLPQVVTPATRAKRHSAHPTRLNPLALPSLAMQRAQRGPATLVASGSVNTEASNRLWWLLGASVRASWDERANALTYARCSTRPPSRPSSHQSNTYV